MRKGLMIGLLVVASTFVGGTALAERSDSDNRSSHSRSVKEKVLEKQKEGVRAHRNEKSSQRATLPKTDKNRPKGDVYSDQAGRSSGKSRASEKSGRNMSASNSVNTPSEIKAMLHMINPMYGAYRMSEASEGTDSYGGHSMVPNGKGGQKNLSATGAVNTPAEKKAMQRMINPMKGAYSTAAAAEGTDSYGGSSPVPYAHGDHTTLHVHFKNDRGEVVNSTHGNTATAMKNREMRNAMVAAMKEKMAKAENIEGK
ncbi:MAG: hypothetical protein U0271_41500 [Polyangiaceae bacterium]